jgi:hypothetical protein
VLKVPGYPAACSMPGLLRSACVGMAIWPAAWPQLTAQPGRATCLMGIWHGCTRITARFCFDLNLTRAQSLQHCSPISTGFEVIPTVVPIGGMALSHGRGLR